MIQINLIRNTRSEQSTIPVLCCAICLTTDARFVRDHDHKTGFIRGILCDQCNSFLGIHEGRGLRKKKHFKWMQDNWQRISAHLKSDTGIKYHGSGQFSNTLRLLAEKNAMKIDSGNTSN